MILSESRNALGPILINKMAESHRCRSLSRDKYSDFFIIRVATIPTMPIEPRPTRRAADGLPGSLVMASPWCARISRPLAAGNSQLSNDFSAGPNLRLTLHDVWRLVYGHVLKRLRPAGPPQNPMTRLTGGLPGPKPTFPPALARLSSRSHLPV